MYRIKLDNCCCEPKITMEFTFEKSKFDEIISYAIVGFRSVEVTDNETGEVIYSHYICDQHFDTEYLHICECIEALCEYVTYKRGY